MMKCALIVAVLASRLFAVCAATERNTDYSVENGAANSVSVTASVFATGDLVGIGAYCSPGCTPVSVTVGAQTAVQTTVSGNSSSDMGQPFLFYVLSAAASGSQTITWTVTGTHAHIQFSYVDYSASAGCSFSHNVDSALGTGTGSTINTPSITPTAGDLLFNYTVISQHVTSVNSPWSCAVFSGSGETQTCFANNTFNTIGYILSAASGATANNMTQISSGDSWQALIASFTMSTGGSSGGSSSGGARVSGGSVSRK